MTALRGRCLCGEVRFEAADCSFEKLNLTTLFREAGRDYWLNDERQ